MERPANDILKGGEANHWFAIRTRNPFDAERALSELCAEVFLPTLIKNHPGRKPRIYAAIPRVLFIRTTHENALELEQKSRRLEDLNFSFWIYRYPKNQQIQIIPHQSIHLLRLLTSQSEDKCEIFNKTEFKRNDYVRITDGIFKGYRGYVQRVKKNLHVVVEIEGICMVMLPFIHPDLLEKVE